MKILMFICLCMLLTAAPLTARGLHLREAVARVQEVGGKIAVACATWMCLLNLPAVADTSYLDDLVADTTLVRTREPGEVFAEPNTLIFKSAGGGLVQDRRSGFSFERSVMSNPSRTSAISMGAIRFSSSGKSHGFNGYLTTAFNYPLHASFSLDNANIQMSSFAGVSGLLIDNGKDKISYVFLMVDTFTGTGMMAHSIFGHLLHYHKEPWQIAAVGYEYLDMDLSAIAGDTGIDGVRTQGLAIYRASFNLPLSERLMSNKTVKINLKLNSSVLLGGMGPMSFGDTWQDDLSHWSEGADLNHSFYHTIAVSLRARLADNRVKLTLSGSRRDTIRGSIRKGGQEQGEFDATNTTLMILGSLDVFPQQKISLDASLYRFNQTVSANFNDGEQHESDGWTTYGLLAVRKLF